MLTHNKLDLRVSQVNEFLHAPLLQGSCKSSKFSKIGMPKNQYGYCKSKHLPNIISY